MDSAEKIALLENQNTQLHMELERLNEQHQAMSLLYHSLSRRMQSVMASIKAASSSLLDHQIFWDAATQHEFLETIDHSVDQGSRLVKILSLTVNSVSQNIHLHPEPQMLQEILVAVHMEVKRFFPELDIKLVLPPDGHPVLVDFDHMTLALSLLIDVLVSQQISGQVKLTAVEDDGNWQINILGIDTEILSLMENYFECQKNKFVMVDRFPAESLLKLLIVGNVLCLSGVVPVIETLKDKVSVLRITIPAYTQKPVMIPDPVH